MTKRKKLSKRKRLSQVPITDSNLVRKLIDRSSISKRDTVVDIGAGSGQITRELIPRSGRIIAVEKDPELCEQLRAEFGGNERVKICQGDALQLPAPSGKYKVFANPPFSIEGELVRRVLQKDNSPQDTYLVMREKVGERMAGVSYNSQFSVIHNPDVDISIFHRFRRKDFSPQPMVQPVMLRINRGERSDPDLSKEENRQLWQGLIRQGFGGGGDIKHNLDEIFTYTQLRRMSGDAEFKLDSKPTDLSFEQWKHIFEVLKDIAAPHQREKTRKILDNFT